jgi:NADPH:quinone reductase-like Zn-dependent oxidoreductase
MNWGPDVLRSDSINTPAHATGDVVVRMRAAGPVDLKIRDGSFLKFGAAQLPVILGRDISGTVEESGSSNRPWPRGMDVFALLDWCLGGYAEYVAVQSALCVALPSRLAMDESAAIPLVE